MSASPTVSVVIPVYNVAPYLQACVDSLLAQRYTDFEVVPVPPGIAASTMPGESSSSLSMRTTS